MSFLKNITSKDIKLSQNTIQNLINTVNIEQFKELCEKSDFIFPFLKERIVSDFVKLINKENLSTLREFSKIHCFDFEDMIVKSWLKFACEDLTDEIIELFETGSLEQKAHAAKYFQFVKDTLALEYLNKYALSDFEPLKINCALALKNFNDTQTLEKAKKIVLESDDDFEIMGAYGFICAYGENENIKFVLKNCFNSPFAAQIISQLLDFIDFSTLKNNCDELTKTRVLALIIDSYPENITLDTIIYWEIFEFIKTVYEFKNPYSTNVLLLAKNKFIEFSENDIYSYDLDKNLKNELKNIASYLKSLNLSFGASELDLYESYPCRFDLALDIIKEYNLSEYAPKLADLLNNNKLSSQFGVKSAVLLKELGRADLIDKNIIDKIDDKNARAIVESCVKQF